MNDIANVPRLFSTLATIKTMFLHLQEDLKKAGLTYEMLQIELWPDFEQQFFIRLWREKDNCPFHGGSCSPEKFIKWFQRKTILHQSFNQLKNQLKEEKNNDIRTSTLYSMGTTTGH